MVAVSTNVIGSTSTPTAAASLNSASAIGASIPAGGMVFPSDLGVSGNFNYWMTFSFYQYTPQTFTNNVALVSQGTIRLPLPNSMVDQQDVNYEAQALGLATGLAMNMAAAGSQAGLGTNNPAAIAAAGVAGQAVNNVTSAALQKDAALYANALQPLGLAVNPFLTVMFKSPAFKEHNFAWQLAPSNAGESTTLSSILNTFKMNQLPGSSYGGALLTYPSIVQITISNYSATNFTYIFKPAVIKSFSANYTPGGQPSFFGSTQAPSIVEMRMSLMEIEFWLNSDYSGITGFGSNISSVTQIQNALTNFVITPAQ